MRLKKITAGRYHLGSFELVRTGRDRWEVLSNGGIIGCRAQAVIDCFHTLRDARDCAEDEEAAILARAQEISA